MARIPPGKDGAWILVRSRARLHFDQAYLAIVREQPKGHDAMLAPATRVHAKITTESTGIEAARRPPASAVVTLGCTDV
jgi:hypothetical protein